MWKTTFSTSIKILIISILSYFIYACTPQKSNTKSVDTISQNKTWPNNLYAEKFSLITSPDSLFLRIESPLGNDYLYYSFPKVNLKTIAVSNSVQWAFLKLLNNNNALPGAVLGHKFFCDSTIHKAVNTGETIEIQGAENIDEEQMILSNCTILLQDGFGRKALSSATNKGYEELFILEWQEKHPLARLEWIKVLGALINQENKAKNIFDAKVKAYESLKRDIEKKSNKCAVMTSAPFKNEWHIPAKNSYMETLISDAGGQLLHNKNDAHVSQKLNLEEAFLAFKNADVWLVNSGIESLAVLENSVPFFDKIKAVNTGQVYNYHKSKAYGNYLFWEDGVCQPEQLLLEYHQMFTSQLSDSKYYQNVH